MNLNAAAKVGLPKILRGDQNFVIFNFYSVHLIRFMEFWDYALVDDGSLSVLKTGPAA